MNLLQILCLMLFVAVSITHLVFVFLEKEKGRMISKGLIVFSLIIFALVSKVKDPLIYLGLIFSLCGDMLLLLKSRKIFFVLGACCFSLTHLMNFIITSRYLPDRLNWMYFVLVILVGYLLIEFVRPFIKKTMKKMSYPSLAYLYFVLALIINTTIVFITTHNPYFLVMMIGGLCFLTSDIILTIYRFVNKFKKGNFVLMIFYILGQSLIYIPFMILLTK